MTTLKRQEKLLVSHLFLVLGMFLPTGLFSLAIPDLPIQQVEAEHIDFNEKLLILTGKVSVTHDIGVIHCNKGILHLDDNKKPPATTPLNKIFLHEAVVIDFSDGSTLTSDEGEIDLSTMEGVFTAQDPSRVVYTGFGQNGHQKNPIQASGRVLRATIIKTDQGYTLSSLKGEGAVLIRYLSTDEQQKGAQ